VSGTGAVLSGAVGRHDETDDVDGIVGGFGVEQDESG
jgi:hypothetical protein